MKLKHMAQKSKKESLGPPTVAGGNGDGGTSGPTYPYGLKISLDHETLGNLGIKALPTVGSHIHIHARAHVASVSQNEDSHKGKKTMRRNVELQIHHMAVGKPDADSAVGAVEDGISQADES